MLVQLLKTPYFLVEPLDLLAVNTAVVIGLTEATGKSLERLPFLIILAHRILQFLKNHHSLVVLRHAPAHVQLDTLGPLLDLTAVLAPNAAFL